MKMMKLTRMTKIRGRLRNKGDVFNLPDPVAARLVAHKAAVQHVAPSEPQPAKLTLAEVEAMRADGMSFRKAKRVTGIQANGWQDLLTQLAEA